MVGNVVWCGGDENNNNNVCARGMRWYAFVIATAAVYNKHNDYNNVLPILNANRIFRSHAVHHQAQVDTTAAAAAAYGHYITVSLYIRGGYYVSFLFFQRYFIIMYVIERQTGSAVVVAEARSRLVGGDLLLIFLYTHKYIYTPYLAVAH